MGFSFPLWVQQQILLRPLAAQDIDGRPPVLLFSFAVSDSIASRSRIVFFPGAATIIVADGYQIKKKKLFTFSHFPIFISAISKLCEQPRMNPSMSHLQSCDGSAHFARFPHWLVGTRVFFAGSISERLVKLLL